MSDRASAGTLLIVEDDPDLRKQLEWSFGAHAVETAGDRASALEIVRRKAPAVVTLDLGLPPDPDGTSEGMATLQEILALSPATKVVVASGHAARESAQAAIASGAYDFYAKPIDVTELRMIVARAFHVHTLEAENLALSRAVEMATASEGIVTGAPEMRAVLRTVAKVAPSDASIMLLGASGTGKELLALALHRQSPRAAAPFVAINCAAIPETLLESELFGYERGAFTGAIKTTIGKIEAAQGGTLFLDEIGDVPPAVQVKLLRFLQERVVERLGGRKPIAIDVRVVTATHQDLAQMIREGAFREDLYFRLAELVLKIPTLAERSGDAVLLAKHFLRQFRPKTGRRITGFTADALAAIARWPWTGNVRELENRVKRATIMADGALITVEDLDFDQPTEPGEQVALRTARERADRVAIANAMALNDGNISAAARDLGISRPMLYNLLDGYDIAKS